MLRTWKIWRGAAAKQRFQCYIRGGLVKAAYNVDDVLTAAMMQPGVDATLFAPDITWNTTAADNTPQTGYEQGQILISITAAQAKLLQAGVSYNLVANRYLASDTDMSDPEKIASIPITVRRDNAQ